MGYVWFSLIIIVFCLFISYVFFNRKTKKPILYNLFSIIQIIYNYHLAENAGEDLGNIILIYIILITLAGMVISWVVYFVAKKYYNHFEKNNDQKIEVDSNEVIKDKNKLILKIFLVGIIIVLCIVYILL